MNTNTDERNTNRFGSYVVRAIRRTPSSEVYASLTVRSGKISRGSVVGIVDSKIGEFDRPHYVSRARARKLPTLETKQFLNEAMGYVNAAAHAEVAHAE